jgi:hypothetical protein
MISIVGYLEEINASGGLFPPPRRALMQDDHERRHAPVPGRYALLVDVAGADEAEGDVTSRLPLANRKRGATALTVVGVAAPYGHLPTYRAVDRQTWLGVKHATLHGEILALAHHWHATFVVVDATGVGVGLASFLEKSLGDRLIAVQFSPKVKSEFGWDLFGVAETGRYRDYVENSEPDMRQFWHEVEHCQHEIRRGPGRARRWGVWETPAYDGLIARGHDDLLLSAALVAVLDKQQWPRTGESGAVERGDVLEEIDRVGVVNDGRQPTTDRRAEPSGPKTVPTVVAGAVLCKLTSPQRLGTPSLQSEDTCPWSWVVSNIALTRCSNEHPNRLYSQRLGRFFPYESHNPNGPLYLDEISHLVWTVRANAEACENKAY